MPGALLLSVVYQHSLWIQKQFSRLKEVFSGTENVEQRCLSYPAIHAGKKYFERKNTSYEIVWISWHL